MEKLDLDLPDVFYELLDQRVKTDTVTLDIFEQYYKEVKGAPSFFYDFVSFFGPEKVLDFIRLYGGISLAIPTARDILSTVRKTDETPG